MRHLSCSLKIFVIFIFCLLCSSCSMKSRQNEAHSRVIQSMDTVMKLTAYGNNAEKALDACEEEIIRLNDLLSTGLESSEISALNREGHAVLSEDSALLVNKSLELFRQTDGAFDLSIYPLACLWGFHTKQYHVPTETELESILPTIGAQQIVYNSATREIVLGEKQAIDLGGIAKGYTSQKLMQILQSKGVSSALVSLGGNVQCLNAKPDGSDWKIGIQSPWQSDSSIYAVVQVRNKAVITSGGYERFFEDEQTGKVYRHILDSKTGYPVESGLASVSIITDDGTLGDGLSTALYVMGLDRACDFWRAHHNEFEMILIDDDGSLYVSEGLAPKTASVHKINIIKQDA